jgi:16S rRNA (uracil1498-N3)-methyltransferase
MHRAHVTPEWIDSWLNNPLTPLPVEAQKRLQKIVRVAPGELVGLFDGRGRQLTGALSPLAGGSWGLAQGVLVEHEARTTPIILAQAAVEEGKVEETILRGTELGVDSFYVFAAERSDPFVLGKLIKRAQRLTTLAMDATRQSGRYFCPEVVFFSSAKELLANLQSPYVGVFGVPQGSLRLSAIVEPSQKRTIVVAVGPEGGFSDAEESLFASAGFVGATWAPFTLRSEFAGLAAVAIVNELLAT